MINAIEPLGKHDRAVFSCGVVALDSWFHLRAGQDENAMWPVFLSSWTISADLWVSTACYSFFSYIE